MLIECEYGKEFLRECDPHVVIPVKNYQLNCGCFFTNLQKSNIAVCELEAENKKLKTALKNIELIVKDY